MARPWTPDWEVAPGEILVEALAARGMTQAELSRRMARPLKTISELANGKAAITPETALQLERALGIAASVWLGLESNYREARARRVDQSALGAQRTWLRRFPIKDLKRLRIITANDATGQLAELLAFFRVSSQAGWDQHWGHVTASYRIRKTATVSRESIATWLRLGELQTEDLVLEPYDADGFRRCLAEVRSLSRVAIFEAAIQELQARLADAGVAFALVEGVFGAPASGAVRWIRDHPLITLTMRYKRDDQFWFSLYHEAGHLLAGRRRDPTLEELPEDEGSMSDEDEADQFARDFLVPPVPLASFAVAADFSRRAIVEFADALDVAPSVIVGRLQREKILKWTSPLNSLKVRLPSPAPRDAGNAIAV